LNVIHVSLGRITGSLKTSLETNTFDTAVGSKSEIILSAPFPPVRLVASIGTNNDCFVIITSPLATILISDGIATHSRVVIAWATGATPSGKTIDANRRPIAFAVAVNVKPNTGVLLFAHNLVTRGRTKGKGVPVVLLKILVIVPACKLQRTRLEDLDTFAFVDFEVPALLPVLLVHANIIRLSAWAGEPHDSRKHQCNDQRGVQELHGSSRREGSDFYFRVWEEAKSDDDDDMTMRRRIVSFGEISRCVFCASIWLCGT
jgi:hypothetical protein